ncbi:retrotransposon gag protein, partial [Trifolium medium]|nr:retrotransposon gag protein [Trifolium medium]
MPPKKTVPKMGDRVDALEGQMGEVQATLQSLAAQMQQQSATLAQQMQQSAAIAQQMQQQNEVLSNLSRHIGQRNTDHVTESVRSVKNRPQEESRLSGKKVKLPVFDGEDPVAWITRAEIYFDVQNTTEEMRVKLARLSMEGATIHWFNLLMETEDHLTWEKLKKSLIARYGGRRLENPF